MKKFLPYVFAAGALLAASQSQAMDELHKKYACTACHMDNMKLVGPAYQDVADKYRADYKKDAKSVIGKLAAKVKAGGSGVWGPTPMAANPAVPDADLQKMVKIILDMPPAKK